MRIGMAAVMGVALAAATGCQLRTAELHLCIRSDAIRPELIQQFEAEHGCKVVIDCSDSGADIVARLKAGASGCDVIVTGDSSAAVMRAQGLLLPLRKDQLQNLLNLDPEYLARVTDKACAYSVPYLVRYAGLAYRKSKVPDFKPSWTLFDREGLKGRMTLLNDSRETIGAALKLLGCSLNSTNEADLARARDVVIRWKKNVARFENEQYVNAIVAGELLVVHGYSGALRQAMEENDDIAFAAPEEGLSVALDVLVIPRDVRQPDLAHAFINFMHDPKAAAENILFTRYLCPNRCAYELLPPAVRDDRTVFVPMAVRAKAESIRNLGADTEPYTKVWEAIQAAE